MRTTARLPLVALLLAIVAALVAGCGSDDDSSPKTSGADRAATAERDDAAADEGLVATVDATLDVELKNVGSKDFAGIPVPTGIRCTKSVPATCSTTIECPAATDDADGVELCAWLASTGSDVLLTKLDPAMACTQQYGGPEVATVTGTIGKQKVDATFSREDGCAIGRFDAASPLWTGEVPDATTPVDGSGSGGATSSCQALPPDTPVSSDGDDPAAGAADEVCATPATSAPTPAPGTPLLEPEIISDPPEAFELEK